VIPQRLLETKSVIFADMRFSEDHTGISIACCGRRFISHRPEPSIAAAGDKGPVAV
jgi:hypothetical protein